MIQKQIKYTNSQISQMVSEALIVRGWSVRECVDKFNRLHGKAIKKGEEQKLNKDFVQRVRSNRFSVVSKRIDALCRFLEIDIYCFAPSVQHLTNEFISLDQVVIDNPKIKQAVKSLLQGVLSVINQGECNEVR